MLFKKLRFILVLMPLSVCLCLMSSTYSRYVADTTGNIDILFSKWQILVNNTDITSGSSSTISFVPVIEENENVAEKVVAPSSKGYFDIMIDPTNVDVSFKYDITLEMDNENIPDLMITKYSIIPKSYVEGDALEVIDLEESVITKTLKYNKNIENFKFDPFTIRVYFEWYEGEDEQMNDEADTEIGHKAATEGETFKINANISFEQVFE